MIAVTRKALFWTALSLIGLTAGCAKDSDGNLKPSWNWNHRGNIPSMNTADLPEAPAHPVEPDTHLAAARLHESLGNFDEAMAQYDQVLQRNPQDVEALNRKAVILCRFGRFDRAHELFTQALKIDESHAHIWNNRAFNFIMQHRWAEAEADLREALTLCPDFCRAHVNLGMALAQQERYDDALVSFKACLSDDDAYYNMGLMYQSKKRMADAAVAYKKALELNPRLTAAARKLEQLPPDVLEAAQGAADAHAEEIAAPSGHARADGQSKVMDEIGPLPLNPHSYTNTGGAGMDMEICRLLNLKWWMLPYPDRTAKPLPTIGQLASR